MRVVAIAMLVLFGLSTVGCASRAQLRMARRDAHRWETRAVEAERKVVHLQRRAESAERKTRKAAARVKVCQQAAKHAVDEADGRGESLAAAIDSAVQKCAAVMKMRNPRGGTLAEYRSACRRTLGF